jgi:hypothetical protein
MSAQGWEWTGEMSAKNIHTSVKPVNRQQAKKKKLSS